MEKPDDLLRQLVAAACKHPPGSGERQKNLTRIIRLATQKLWREYTPYYQDALQQTWVYFCQNLCEGTTGACYDPDRASVVTWLNNYLKRRLQDGYIEVQKQKAQTFSKINLGDDESFDPINNLAANPDIPPLLEEVRKWVVADPTQQLRRTYISDRPDLNCQVLILRRLPPETPWKTLAEEFGVSIGTLSSFYQRQCLPRLREFGKEQGYL
ncbi:MAG TPA: sigma-70 family RNA polymerase sigma factor [Oscillatoriales cyanobacterium M59_W2019_021]|nr:sigma-70 family RNA polymerase sigma factor [Oscillatoriales cyanobacterium M4454_W2019_049]HIK50758.1 sigma-70 family RNA polymerase sigma factor [Oscillatoriales cyanobacterium M59_W2019_021]